MANERIGTAPCPLCRQPAGVTVSKAELTVLTCNRCNCQLFTRSDMSDGLLREKLQAAAPAPAPVADPEPPVVEEETQEAPQPAPVPPPAAPAKNAWDIY